MGHFWQLGRFEFVCIFMRRSDVRGGIPGVPSNFYPSLKIKMFKGVFSLHKKNQEGFVDAV